MHYTLPNKLKLFAIVLMGIGVILQIYGFGDIVFAKHVEEFHGESTGEG